MRFFFHRGERLRSEKIIQSLFQEGIDGFRYPFRYSYLLVPPEGPDRAKVAFIVPKRKIKKASDRNLIRRRMREAYRKNKHLLYREMEGKSQCLALIIVWVAQGPLSYQMTEQKIIVLLRDLVSGLPKEKIDI